MHIHIDSPVAKSPTATDSLLLTRRQQRPTGRQSQASTGASSPSKQDQARGLDSTPYHILTRSPTATYQSPSASASPCFYAQVVNQDPACGLDSTPFHIDATVPNCRHHRHRLHWLWSTKTHSSSATGQPPQPGLSKTPPSRTHGHTHNNFAISIGL